MDIVLCTDNRYVMPTGVLMYSIGVNNDAPIEYHILVGLGFSDESRLALEKVANKFNSRCHFYEISEDVTRDLPFDKEGMPKHVSIATYYRLFLTEVFPANLHKVLYLDGDMIVRHSLSELWKVDLMVYS